MKYFLLLSTFVTLIPWTWSLGQAPGIWAASDAVKADRFDLSHPYKSGNYVWDGDSIRIFGALNEMLAFQVIIESGIKPLTVHKAGLKELVHKHFPENSIKYMPPDADPTAYAGRPIQVFNTNYMEVKEATNASWIHLPSRPSAIPDPLGWKPVQLVPENARAGKGGYPLDMGPMQNQSIWFDIYISSDLMHGIYLGDVLIETSEGDFSIPVRLDVFDFPLPDKNSLNAMFFYNNYNPLLYMGDSSDFDERFHRFAHRQRVEFVHAYDVSSASASLGRFNGDDFTWKYGYEGPGENMGNIIVPRTFYGAPDDWLDPSTARNLSDAWMTFIRDSLPDAITFLYMPDEPGPSEFPFIKKVADNIHSNPGIGKDLKILVTHSYTGDLDGYIDIWATVPGLLNGERVKIEKAKGNQMWFYNGGRPHVGAIINDAPASDTRMISWAAFKEGIGTYFYWHVCHWYHNHQFGPGKDSPLRKQNIWQNTITFERRPQYDDWANGDGVLVYPGRELIHPEEDRGISGPVSSIRMANFRRGMQDHLYLTMARDRGLDELIDEALASIVPGVFMEVNPYDTVHYEMDPDKYDHLRYRIGKAISESDGYTGSTDEITGNSCLQIFPNPISGHHLYLQFQAEKPFEVHIDIFDLQGRLAGRLLHTESNDNRLDETIILHGERKLKQGMYLLHINMHYSNGERERRILKIIRN